jgi:hypothetical protein
MNTRDPAGQVALLWQVAFSGTADCRGKSNDARTEEVAIEWPEF